MRLFTQRRILLCGSVGLWAVLLVLTSTSSVGARQGRGGGAPAGPTLVPLTASSLSMHPELYIGQTVAVTAAVEKTISATAFTVDQDRTKSSSKDVLVIAQYLQGTPPSNAYVTVIGEAIRFDPAIVAAKLKGYTLDLPADVLEKYKGQPAVLATSVVDAGLKDIAKKPIAPLTPAEEALRANMKTISPEFTALRASADASDAASVREKAADLKKQFTDVKGFFATRMTVDAIGFASDAIRFAGDIETNAAAGKWDDVKASATSLNGLCGSCHTAHRERLDDGTFRVK
jgi:cytochrome c556